MAFEEMTRDRVTMEAQRITELIAGRIQGFLKQTGCCVRAIDVVTDEKPLGQTGLFQIKQDVQVHFTIPQGHPAAGGAQCPSTH